MPKLRDWDYSCILSQAMGIAALSVSDVAYVCWTDEATVNQWVEGSESPSFSDLYLLQTALVLAGKDVCRDLQRLVSSRKNHAVLWAKENRTGRKYKSVGNKVEPVKYVYKGNLLKVSEIANLLEVETHLVRNRIIRSGLKTGQDVTEVDFELVDRRLKQK